MRRPDRRPDHRPDHRPPAGLLASLAAAGLLAACAQGSPEAPPAAAPAAAQPGLCRIGPDGGPPVLAEGERGIGGTGVLAAAEAPEGERGIGGTGIVGVVTGFASICVNGLHVAYDPGMPVDFVDGVATPAALRVGQVVVVRAEGPEADLRARRIAVRHELGGVVEAAEEGAIRVAGQRVSTAGAWPAGRAWAVGEAVLVSGLWAPDGSLTATRIDPRPAGGASLVMGRLTRGAGGPRIGNLRLRLMPGLALPPDGPVVARGRMEDGLLVADSVEPDRLMRDPPGFLGTARVLMEAQIGFGGGRMLLGPGLSVSAGPGMGPGAAGRRVVELRGGAGRSLSAAGLRGGGDPPGPASGRVSGLGAAPGGAARGEPAPVPDRRFESRRGMERDGAGRWNGGDRRGGAARREGGAPDPRGADAPRGDGTLPGRLPDGAAQGPGRFR
ncbi:hypothetical protein SAMN02745194_03561 [Roseomonas rosea]|uniref:DUF5666 domain-containing protein n=1 Tax=Muricoccus roseus TaxID=198092 RepID=A0A1M6MRX8_9PROT|nr:DUF5666 domain-containing protein [Roseomonas rosea]SHJ86275.1 hypothetical protein SAMN02745194_03561 [Roseomonas rosea]